MSNTCAQNGTEGATAGTLPSTQTDQQSAANALAAQQPAAAPRALSDQEIKKAMRRRLKTAEREFSRDANSLACIAPKDFQLRISVTFSYIILLAENREDYAADVLKKLKEARKGKWAPDENTIQHYSGPMRRWLREMARIKNPDDPNLAGNFLSVFLHEHPQYILNVSKQDEAALVTECETLDGLDQKYGNGRVKPRDSQPIGGRKSDAMAKTSKREAKPVNEKLVADGMANTKSPQKTGAAKTPTEPPLVVRVATGPRIPKIGELIDQLRSVEETLKLMYRAHVDPAPAKEVYDKCLCLWDRLTADILSRQGEPLQRAA